MSISHSALDSRSLCFKKTVLPRNYKIFLNYILGPILFIWLAYSIYQQIEHHQDLGQSWSLIKATLQGEGRWMLFLVLFLMPINWGIEAKKWQLLASNVQVISYWSAFKAILSGQAFALNTLNRSGDFLGKILYLEEGNRLRAVGLSLIGSMSQLFITFLMGFFSLASLRYILLDTHTILPGISVFILDGLLIGLIPGIILFGLLYFNVALFVRLMERWPFIGKYKFFLEKMENLHARDLTRILLLSGLRYVVYIVQYGMMLHIFGVDANWFLIARLVALLLMLMAMVPTIALAELGVRGKLGLQLFGLITSNQLSILAVTAGIWVINLIIPAILGSVLLLGLRLFKQKEQEA